MGDAPWEVTATRYGEDGLIESQEIYPAYSMWEAYDNMDMFDEMFPDRHIETRFLGEG